MPVATCGREPRGKRDSSPSSGCPQCPHRLSLQIDPLVPSPEPCSRSGKRCFLRQPWLQPLQLEHSRGGGKRNRAMGGGWALGAPSPLLWSECFHGPRQKLQWTSMVQLLGLAGFLSQARKGAQGGRGVRGALPQNLCWNQRLLRAQAGMCPPLGATAEGALAGQAWRGRPKTLGGEQRITSQL